MASFLGNQDLLTIRQLCKMTQFAVSPAVIFQPFYNRLYALDNTLSPLLPQENTLAAFKDAFEKIQARQQQEIDYLTQHHSALMTQPEYTEVLQENSSGSLKSLEAKNALLDKVNSDIIRPKINVNMTHLQLARTGITRLPVRLFQEPAYVPFWQNLTNLGCGSNQLTTLNVQGLAALQELYCFNNQLTTLNVQGLAALRVLECSKNKLTALNVQRLMLLQFLLCHDNQLTSLEVQGLVALEKLFCFYNQLTTLDVQGLAALRELNCSKNKLTALNVQELMLLHYLLCHDNRLSSLEVQELVALQVLLCFNNQLTSLNVQGLAALRELKCSKNKLTALNVQDLAALKLLYLENNPLNTLILTGVHADIKNKYAELKRSLLFKKLSQVHSPEARQAIIVRLEGSYTYKNCLYYCPVYAAKLFASDSANSAYSFGSTVLSRAAAFLPSFSLGANNPASEEPNLKRQRDEEAMQVDGMSEESENQSDLKKRKKD